MRITCVHAEECNSRPAIAQVTVAVFRHGEHFDSFAAIRADRKKYRPRWSPRYLVCPGDLMLPRVLRDAAALICPTCRSQIMVGREAD